MHIRTIVSAAAASRTALALVLAVLGTPAGIYASMIYDLTLTANYDSDSTPLSSYSGTGTITISSAPGAAGLSNYGSAPVTFLIDGESFSGTATSVEFLNGSFYNASFSEQIGSSPSRFDLQTSGVYAFYYDNELQEASGSIAAAPALNSVPEPALLPVVLLLLAGLCVWRARTWAVLRRVRHRFDGDSSERLA